MFTLQITLAARYLWGRKLRTILTTLAIVFGVLVIFGMNILIPTIVKAFQSNLLAASGQVRNMATMAGNIIVETSTINQKSRPQKRKRAKP